MLDDLDHCSRGHVEEQLQLLDGIEEARTIAELGTVCPCPYVANQASGVCHKALEVGMSVSPAM